MQRNYATVRTTAWTGLTANEIRALGPDAVLVYLFLMTSPFANMLGIYHCPVELIAFYTAIPVKRAKDALRKVCSTGFAAYDADSKTVFVRRAAAFQLGERLAPGDKRLPMVQKQFEALRRTKFGPAFHAIYREAYQLPDLSPTDAPLKDLPRGIDAPSMPHRSQEQEQTIQDPEQEQLPNQNPGAGDGASLKEQVASVNAKYLEFHPKGPKRLSPTSMEYKLIRDRLAEGFTVECLREAIEGNHKSPFHCGENDKRREYHNLALIVRSSSHVTQFIEHANGKRQHSDPRGTLAALDQFLSSSEQDDHDDQT